MIDLAAAGLSPTEAKCYTVLLEKKEWKPADLAKSVNETRTNCYKILDNLVALGLAERFDKDKKLHFRAANPLRLLEIARTRRAQMEASEKELELQTDQLVHEYVKHNEQPGVQFYQGKEGIRQIFAEMAQSKDEVAFISTKSSIDFYGFQEMHELRMMAVSAGVERRALTPDVPTAPKNYEESDERTRLKRTWLKDDDYTAPVEWGTFDDKVFIISYGNEALGMTIQSAQIAQSFKQLHALLERGQRLLPDYDTLPKKANFTRDSSET